MKKLSFLTFITFWLLLCGCTNAKQSSHSNTNVIVGAENLSEYLPLLENKKVGMVVNNTSKIGNEHLIDILLKNGVSISTIFAPEHGFRGEASAGEKINNSRDPKTGIEIVSLYGKNKKPTPDQLKDIDVLVFDIQDVGVRFYTYISTLHYVMVACAENQKKLVILDRPNPNGHYVAGPVLDMKYQSFVGINPIPIVYGLTIGELAFMNNEEGWLGSNLKCDLKVIKCQQYKHNMAYKLPEKPSPNLPNQVAIGLYPSICLFEATQISVGRGTEKQFQVIGGLDRNLGSFSFTPVDKPGAMDPLNEGKTCYGLDLSKQTIPIETFNLRYIIDFYKKFSVKKIFFTNRNFFNLLVGNDWVIKDIEAGKNAQEIEAKWQPELEEYKKKRKKYLLYED